MELILGTQVINSYKRLSYKHWYALAEFVDNSTQVYLNNKDRMDTLLAAENEKLFVKIVYSNDAEGAYISIEDNSVGMSKEELQRAVTIGIPPEDTTGRSKYGLGMKTAACWLGDSWTVHTKKHGETQEHRIKVNVPQIATGNTDLGYEVINNLPENTHYTKIKINRLHTNIQGRTSGKIREFLMSIYRKDFENYGLRLFWQGEQLKWNKQELLDRLIKENGEPKIRTFEFVVNNKHVNGWVGVFESGSRKDAGLSVIQAERVIKGWPDAYRPSTLYGEQEGGINNLVNQRLVGELYLDGFEVSHTKDEILYDGDEENELETKLLENCGDFKRLAQEYRKYKADEREVDDEDIALALNLFEKELVSPQIKEILFIEEVPPPTLISESNKVVKDAVIDRSNPTLNIRINELNIQLYINEDMSPFEPYVIIEATSDINSVIVIVNKAHPYWKQLNNSESVLNFIRHCAYDGVSEWKAYFKARNLEPQTIKLIKDNLLRLPFLMEEAGI